MATTSTKTVEKINGQTYQTITEDEGLKLMQRITKPGQEADSNSDQPDFVLIENPTTKKPRKSSISSVRGQFASFIESIVATSKKESNYSQLPYINIKMKQLPNLYHCLNSEDASFLSGPGSRILRNHVTHFGDQRLRS